MSLVVVLAVAFVVVAGRLTHLQVVAAERYVAAGEAQRVRSVTLPASRGAIFDRNGEELALSVSQHTVWADPRLVTDPVATATALAPVLGVEQATLADRLSRDGAFTYLARQVGDETAAAVEELALPGVDLMPEARRFRPAEDLAASVIGGVGLDNTGLSGVERQFDELLTGEPGELVAERGIAGDVIAAGDRHLQAPTPGADVVLTIDRSLQYEVERSLGEAITSSDARGGMAAVMDPRSGEILAMASLRADPEGGPPRSAANNMAVTDVFEPGSVNKMITLSAALEEGLFEPDSVLTVPDRLQVSVHEYEDHDAHEPMRWTVADILTNSSNVGSILIAQELGKERLDSYLRDFGFGATTGLDFPGESAGIVLDLDEWKGTSIGSVPIGSGLAVTAVQMLTAYNVIANGGVYVAPKLVQATVDADGTHEPTPPSARREVVSPETARQMSAMLSAVVDRGTGTNAAIDHYTVAGKTGTARKPQENGTYKDAAGHYHHMSTFAGFVPAEHPQLSVIVVLDEPTPIYGGVVAAPVFAEVASYGLRLFRIPPASDDVDLTAPVTDDAVTPESRNDLMVP